MLLAELVDTLHWLQWVKTRTATGPQHAARVPRPGTVKRDRDETETGTAVGGQSASHNRMPDRAEKLKHFLTGR
jgi:hypothetical protein